MAWFPSWQAYSKMLSSRLGIGSDTVNGLRVHRGIGDRVLVVDQVVAHTPEALDGVCVRRSPIPKRRLVVEVRGLDDERVAFPVPARVAVPMANGLGQVRTAVERNHPHVMDVLVEDGDDAGRLEDLIRVVVPGRERRHAVVHDAAIGGRAIQAGIGRVRPLIGLPGGARLLRLGRQRRKLAIGRIDDERGAADRLAAIPPEVVVGARVAGRGAVVLLGSGPLRELVDLLVASATSCLQRNPASRAASSSHRTTRPGGPDRPRPCADPSSSFRALASALAFLSAAAAGGSGSFAAGLSAGLDV